MDAFTLVVASALASIIMAGSMALLYRADRRQRCLLDWMAAGLCFTGNSVLGAVALELQLDHFLVPACGNALYVAGHFGILAGVRRHVGLASGWALLALVAAAVFALHLLPALQASVTHRLLLFTPLIVALNATVVATLWRHLPRGGRAAYVPLAAMEGVFLLQLSLRALYLAANRDHALTLLGNQFLQTSGTLFVLIFLSVTTMSCALIVASRQVQALRHAALTDALTGWRNRRSLHDMADAAFERRVRDGGPLAFVTFDIDHFKSINDRNGHDVGDEVIVAVAKLCGTKTRDSDVAARIGGEEFAVLLADVAPEAVRDLAEAVRARIAAAPLRLRDHVVPMTVSAGVATRSPHDGSWEDILRRADEALYHAKTHGRNRVDVHSREVDAGLRDVRLACAARA
jgi:diguanylate cyclase (GGDEF)-like protein